jgi:alpha-beta hydrolase superfamily lysophospholipase
LNQTERRSSRDGEGVFLSTEGAELFFRWWAPPEPPRAVVAVVHGFGEHGGRYAHVGRHMAARSVAAYALDLRGHGRSAGPRGHVDSWGQYREDVRRFLLELRTRKPVAPLFLLGHSMGGLVALDVALRHPQGLRGLIVASPILSPPGVSRVLRGIGRVASRVWPTLTLDTRLDPAVLSRDPAVLDALRNDPLAHWRASARLSTEIASAVRRTVPGAHRMRVPLLLLHGTADRLTSPAATRAFHEQVASADRQLLLYEGGHHELFNDIERERVLGDVSDWIDRHLPPGDTFRAGA